MSSMNPPIVRTLLVLRFVYIALVIFHSPICPASRLRFQLKTLVLKIANISKNLLPIITFFSGLLLTGCGLPSANVNSNSPAANAATPQTLSATSAAWKVTIESVESGKWSLSGASQSETLSVNVKATFEYLAPDAEQPSPSVSLITATGDSVPIIQTGMSADDNIAANEKILGPSNVPKSVNANTPNFGLPENIMWAASYQGGPGKSEKPRRVKTGEHYTVTYIFKSPANTNGLVFRFNDVPPITLPAPKPASSPVAN